MNVKIKVSLAELERLFQGTPVIERKQDDPYTIIKIGPGTKVHIRNDRSEDVYLIFTDNIKTFFGDIYYGAMLVQTVGHGYFPQINAMLIHAEAMLFNNSLWVPMIAGINPHRIYVNEWDNGKSAFRKLYYEPSTEKYRSFNSKWKELDIISPVFDLSENGNGIIF
jgi:hypothetical protein